MIADLGRITLTKIRALDRRMMALIMLLISTAILGTLFYSQKDVLLHQRWELNWSYLGIAFVVHALALLIVALLWADILDAFGRRLPLVQHLRNYTFSNLAKRIPGTLWYIAGRGYLYQSAGISVASITVACSVEFGITLLSGMLVTIAFAFPQLFNNQAQSILVAVGALACLVLIQPRSIRWFLQKLKVEQQAQVGYQSLMKWLLGYILVWVLGGVIVFAIAKSFSPISLADLPTVIGSWCLAGVISSAFFFFPSNLGVTEVSLSFLLSRIMPTSTAVVVAILVRVVITIFEIIWALISLASFKILKDLRIPE
ncbi:MAG: hypothetical protein PHQ40_15215 [Anaerolineaceae bacterium]|nr:hypothetical protein [Anaerolineaceae bacterium]